ncbi:MAG: metal-dependent transcriptional regulator, partial [Lewinellaceae bacterium]|nr:metal-dependent transcriptional regulator [Lewinellaceae bacterium]
HEFAEQLEHIQGDLLTQQLDKFLGYPRFDPHGEPIPDAEGKWETQDQISLAMMSVGDKGKITNVADDSSVFLQYLNQIGLELNSEIEVLQQFPYDHSVKVRLNNQELLLSEKVSQNLFVKK